MQDFADFLRYPVHPFDQLPGSAAGLQAGFDEQAEGFLGGLDEFLEIHRAIDMATAGVALDQRMGQPALGVDALGEAVETVGELADGVLQQAVDLPGMPVEAGKVLLHPVPQGLPLGLRRGVRFLRSVRHTAWRPAGEPEAGRATGRQHSPERHIQQGQSGRSEPGQGMQRQSCGSRAVGARLVEEFVGHGALLGRMSGTSSHAIGCMECIGENLRN
ncbi:hypothetical protein D9M70_499120 [compost metagenome]